MVRYNKHSMHKWDVQESKKKNKEGDQTVYKTVPPLSLAEY